MTDLHTTTIPARFRGPTESGNGGYSAGVLGALIGDAAQVSLRIPPPLDRTLDVTEHEGEWQLLDGHTLVAAGRALAGPLLLDVPAPPSLDQLEDAESRYSGHHAHPYPECFVCGPQREPGDGLRLFTGQVDGRRVVASHWTPEADVAGHGDPTTVDRRIVWAALDCPSYFGGQLAGYPEQAVLGTIAAEILAPVPIGETYTVIGWPIDEDGRKWHGGAAIYNAAGTLLAFSKGTWVDISGK